MASYRVLYVAHTTSTARLWTVSLQQNSENEGYPILWVQLLSTLQLVESINYDFRDRLCGYYSSPQ